MSNKIHNISVLGDGGWGTTLAIHLAKQNFPVRLWGPFPAYVHQVQTTRHNTKFLPGITIPHSVQLTEDLTQAVEAADLIVFAIPSKYAADVLKNIRKTKVNVQGKTILSVTKGIDTRSHLRMSEMIHQTLGHNLHFAALSGPTIAGEIVRGIPSTAVVASANLKTARSIQNIFNSQRFRIYVNNDVPGTEWGGSIKNIIAIACGVCDGLGFGSNTKAAVMTRGLTEMARLGQKLGAKQKTFYGLTGLGDLVTTCFNPHSRNRSVGEALGRGKSIKSILSQMVMVAEGVETVKAVYQLSRKHQVPMPITTEVYNIIYRHKKSSQAVEDLMKRKIKTE